MQLKNLFHAGGIAATLVFSSMSFASVAVGDAAPAFSLSAASGKTVSLKDYAGKHVVLEWTNADCPFVKKHYAGNMQALQNEFTGKEVIWLSIISSAPGKQGHVDAATARKLTSDRNAAPTDVLIDESGDVGRSYGAKTTPHMFVVNPDGNIVYAGGIDSIPSADPADIGKATPYVKVALNQVLAGEPVTENSTRPYGCSIKY